MGKTTKQTHLRKECVKYLKNFLKCNIEVKEKIKVEA